MEEREIGRTGVRLPELVLGCGNFGGIGSAPELFGHGESDEQAHAIMDAAWSLGMTAFDTADAYGGGRSETAIGKWIRATGNRPTLTTKTFAPMEVGEDHGLGRDRILRQIESSLERLGVDHVDLYLAHAPDPDTPVEETFGAFEELVERGLIRAYGVSNVAADELRVALAAGRPALVQNSYSLLDRGDEQEVLPLCAEHGVVYEAFSPLAGGWLTGKYRRGEEPPGGSRMTKRPGPYEQFREDRVYDALEAFAAAASERGLDSATLAHAWLLAQPNVTALIVGPRRPEHLETATAALDVKLSPGEADELAALLG
ncbi:MAG: aldo/keto reductase [Actinobacteria bacterium]|nr:MAG: aldo/keto reductase [Actinomycetota bacterium]